MKNYKCFYCKEKTEEETIKYNISNTENEVIKNFHQNCLNTYISERVESVKENKDWNELYQYIKKEILSYDDSMKLSSYMVLRLQGLRNGTYSANRNSKVFLSTDGYPYKTILLTFKTKKPDIVKSLKTVNFKDEQHKTNYMITIISNNINDVCLRIKEKEKSKERLNNIEISLPKSKDEYLNKTDLSNNKIANALQDLF